jgi:hypothetical protein
MEPTEGLSSTPAAVTACRNPARTGEESIHSRRDISGCNEWRWAPMRVVV